MAEGKNAVKETKKNTYRGDITVAKIYYDSYQSQKDTKVQWEDIKKNYDIKTLAGSLIVDDHLDNIKIDVISTIKEVKGDVGINTISGDSGSVYGIEKIGGNLETNKCAKLNHLERVEGSCYFSGIKEGAVIASNLNFVGGNFNISNSSVGYFPVLEVIGGNFVADKNTLMESFQNIKQIKGDIILNGNKILKKAFKKEFNFDKQTNTYNRKEKYLNKPHDIYFKGVKVSAKIYKKDKTIRKASEFTLGKAVALFSIGLIALSAWGSVKGSNAIDDAIHDAKFAYTREINESTNLNQDQINQMLVDQYLSAEKGIALNALNNGLLSMDTESTGLYTESGSAVQDFEYNSFQIFGLEGYEKGEFALPGDTGYNDFMEMRQDLYEGLSNDPDNSIVMKDYVLPTTGYDSMEELREANPGTFNDVLFGILGGSIMSLGAILGSKYAEDKVDSVNRELKNKEMTSRDKRNTYKGLDKEIKDEKKKRKEESASEIEA
jgi:hypothetical protein